MLALYEYIRLLVPVKQCPMLIYSFLVELKEPVGQIVCTDKGILAVEQNKVLIPPSWNKTFAWGYADLSCRLGTYESDKVRNCCMLPLSILLSLGLDCLCEW